MKKEKVRCWRVGKNDELLITYPEGDSGHRLICCKSCGKVYAVNVIKQLYIKSDLDKHLKHVACLKCNANLANNWFYYPDKYVDEYGSVGVFERPTVIPNDDSSIIIEFYEVFS